MNLSFRNLIIAVFVITCSTVFAQKKKEEKKNKLQLNYKLEIGYKNTGLRSSRFEDKDTSTTYYNNFRAGLNVELTSSKYKNFSLLSGILFNVVYSNKLQNYKQYSYVQYFTYGQSIDIPLRFQYSVPFNKNLKAFVYGGPNLNFGIRRIRGIVSTLDTTSINFTGITSKSENLYKSSLLNRLNLQVGLGAGLQWKKFMLKSGYDYGILNLNEGSTRKLYEGGWYVSFGYDF